MIESKNNSNRSMCLIAALGLLCLVSVLATRPLATQYHLLKAQSEIREREFSLATKRLESLLRWNRTAEVHFWLARLQRKVGSLVPFETHLQEAERLGLDQDRAQREWSLALTQSGRLAMNDPQVTELLNGDESDIVEVYDAVVQGAFHQFDTDLAVSLLDSWQSGFPNDPQPYYYRGFYHTYEKEWKKAEDSFRRTLDFDESRIDARLGLAKSLREQHRYSDALEHYRQCMQHDNSADMWHGIGECLIMQGTIERAQDAYKQGIAQDANHYECLLALGQLELNAGRGDDALPWLLQALAQKPHEFNAMYAVARAFQISGKSEQATKHFRLASKTQAATAKAEALTRYLADHPDEIEKRFELGKLLIEHGQADIGVSWLRGVLKLDPHHRATRELLTDQSQN